jgi:hypothetical protein
MEKIAGDKNINGQMITFRKLVMFKIFCQPQTGTVKNFLNILKLFPGTGRSSTRAAEQD